MKNDPKRATGRTTGLMLQALGKAVENPGMEVEFVDHHEQNHAQLQYCAETIEYLAGELRLDVTVRIEKTFCNDEGGECKLLVKSNWISPYAQRSPAEEAFKKVFFNYPDKQNSGGDLWIGFREGFEAAQKQ
jgi:hypothetical protein